MQTLEPVFSQLLSKWGKSLINCLNSLDPMGAGISDNQVMFTTDPTGSSNSPNQGKKVFVFKMNPLTHEANGSQCRTFFSGKVLPHMTLVI